MIEIKNKVLKDFDDTGADTLRRYFTQLEYTAYWAIRMLRPNENIESIYPEVVDDLVIAKDSVYHLYQVKTQNESLGAWTTAKILPIVCKQYYSRKAFPGDCEFHFISDNVADTETTFKNGGFGSLYRLKALLELQKNSGFLSVVEQAELQELENIIIPQIQKRLDRDHKETVDEAHAKALLYSSHIETNCPILGNITNNNIVELNESLRQTLPGLPLLNPVQLYDFYIRILIMIANKICNHKTVLERKVMRLDVMDCRVAPSPSNDSIPDLDKVPGDTILDKKLYLGGFDQTEWPRFHRQKHLANSIERKLHTLGLQDSLEALSIQILDLQGDSRHQVCRNEGITENPGPIILDRVRPALLGVGKNYFPTNTEVNEQFCLGLLWNETGNCQAWWNSFKCNSKSLA